MRNKGKSKQLLLLHLSQYSFIPLDTPHGTDGDGEWEAVFSPWKFVSDTPSQQETTASTLEFQQVQPQSSLHPISLRKYNI